MASLDARKNKAISVFRQTANELAAINEGLSKSLGTLGQLQAFIASQTESANKMIADNEAVRGRILDIIGE